MRTIPLVFVCLLALPACDDKGASSGEAKGGEAKSGEAKGDGPVGAFSKYKAKSMASEAKVNVAAIVSGVQMYFEEEHVDPSNPMEIKSRVLPPAATMTPAAGTCCKEPEGKCAPEKGDWSGEGWKAVRFQPADPHRYSYEMAVAGDTITVRAVGDLDCDGEFSTYESVGTIVDGALQFSPTLLETQPLE